MEVVGLSETRGTAARHVFFEPFSLSFNCSVSILPEQRKRDCYERIQCGSILFSTHFLKKNPLK